MSSNLIKQWTINFCVFQWYLYFIISPIILHVRKSCVLSGFYYTPQLSVNIFLVSDKWYHSLTRGRASLTPRSEDPRLRWFVNKMKLWGNVYLKSMYLLLLFIDMVLSISIRIFNMCINLFSSNLRLSEVNIKFDPISNCWNFLIKQILSPPDSSLILYKSAAMFSPLMILKGPWYDFRWKFHFWYLCIK